ncbi:hypothetical protein PPERSA_07176 [Pseudocohnilembus persalinus]|uniref:Par3/HAL N-terminal domain-containing protein n=1 Tax=Pseudocohnilembus persalinus TaxID=266149 RepID=A0A0V0QYN7_PSEPJ|nr:hypothetical protein PPERSA_07176 [Pseudocohnilembus persalinus]|eukprot:KRX07013.1 hypothetical protein PPERSA_07176 [Pseudocohnilembus persalinus]
MKVEVHIKDQSFVINCGEGNQKIRWLGDVAVFRYEQFFEPVNGCPKGVKFETGDLLPMDGIINQVLDDEMHVWVILKGYGGIRIRQGKQKYQQQYLIKCFQDQARWLGDVAVYRYDKQYGMVTGPPKGVKIENGAVIPLDGIISQNLENGQKVWIQLNDDMDKLHDVKRSQGKNSIKNIMLSKNK